MADQISLRRETNLYDDETIKAVNDKVTSQYAVSITPSNTVAKTATVDGTFTLFKNARVSVFFQNANTSTSPTLNVAGTGAKPIWAYGGPLSADGNTFNWVANSTIEFVYDGEHWLVADSGAVGLISKYDDKLNQEVIFNKLTNNGVARGIFLNSQTNQLYINMDYLQTGTLKLGGANNGNGLQVVYDENGNETGRWDKDGIYTGNDKVTFLATPTLNGTYVGFIKLYSTSYPKFGIEFKVTTPQAATETCITISRSDKTQYETTTSGSVFISDRYTAYNSTNILSSFGIEHYAEEFYIGTHKYSDASMAATKRTGGISVGRGVFKYTAADKTDTAAVLSLSKQFSTTGSSVSGRGFYLNVSDTDVVNNRYESTAFFGYAGDANTALIVDGANSRVFINTANCYLHGNQYGWSTEHGSLSYQSSSSKRYKHDITDKIDEKLDAHKLYKLLMKQFVFNDEHIPQYDDMRGMTVPGFIAEDVAEIYPAAVIHDAEGNIESWDERRIIPGMLALIQEQKKQLDEQAERIKKLESNTSFIHMV